MQYNNPEYHVQNIIHSNTITYSILGKSYMLLSLLIMFSFITSIGTLNGILSFPGPFLSIILMFGSMYLASFLSRTIFALPAVFCFAGCMGYTISPLLYYYLNIYANGQIMVLSSIGATGLIFTGLSVYTLISRKNFNYLSSLLFISLISLSVLSIIGIFLKVAIFSVLISCASVVVVSGLILFQTSQMVYSGEYNYIEIAISLYASIFNIFTNLLQVLSFFVGNKRN